MTMQKILEYALRKALDKTKLVLVERTRHDKSGDHVTKKWVSADKVEKTDAVLANKGLLEKDHPALKNKPSPQAALKAPAQAQPAKPKPAASGKKNPLAKLAALQAKKKPSVASKPKPKPATPAAAAKPADVPKTEKPKPADVSPSQKKANGTSDPKPASKPAPKPAAAKPKNDSAPGKTQKPAPKKPEKPAEPEKIEPPKTPGVTEVQPEKPDTYAKTEPPKPREKPPVSRGDMKQVADSIYNDGNADMSSSAIRTVLESVRSDTDSQQLDPGIAASDNEKAYVDLINSITDSEMLKKIAYTGVIPEDADSGAFMDSKLYRHYKVLRDPAPQDPTYLTLGKISSDLHKYIPDAHPYDIKKALEETGLCGPEFAFRMAFPAESTMILGSTKFGNRHVPANTDTMRYKSTTFTSLSTMMEKAGSVFSYNGDGVKAIRDIVQSVGEREPSLAQECTAWLSDFDAIMTACGSDPDKMDAALNNTYDRVSGIMTKEQYNTIVGGALKLYGASLTDGGSTAFDGDYASLTNGDCIRMTYAATGSMERQAVIANVMNAHLSAAFAETALEDNHASWTKMHPASGQEAHDNILSVRTISLESFRAMQEYVSNTNDTPNARESNPHYTQSRRAQVFARTHAPELFETEPSPVLDAFRGAVETAAGFSANKGEDVPAGQKYDASMLKPVAPPLSVPDFGEDELLGLRAMAFSNANCSIRSVTGDKYDALRQEVQYKEEGYDAWKKQGGEGPKGSNIYPEREIVMRGAYEINNSKLAERYDERRAKDKEKGGGKEYRMPLYHGTGFGAACAVLHDGGFRIHGVQKASGTTLGPGVYIGKSTGKVVPYAATGGCYSAEWQELMYDGTDDYSHEDISDGIIFKVSVSKGMKAGKSSGISGAKKLNRNSGGSCDVVESTGYKAWEAVVASTDLVCPRVMIDAGERFNHSGGFYSIHSKNKSQLDTHGPRMAVKTTNTNGKSILDAFLKELDKRGIGKGY